MDVTIYDMAVSPIPLYIWLWLLPFLGFGVLVELLDQKLKKKRRKVKISTKIVIDKYRGELSYGTSIDPEVAALKKLVSKAAWAMRKKIGHKYEEGWSGWDDPDMLPVLKRKLVEHVNRDFSEDNMVDVMNLAAMIWNIGDKSGKANSRPGKKVTKKDRK